MNMQKVAAFIAVTLAGCAGSSGPAGSHEAASSAAHASAAAGYSAGAGGSHAREQSMELGNFSVSLTVKDLAASRAFYEKLGFQQFAGDAAQNWLILKNGDCIIGLFQGMFERNILTFNPGWDGNAQKLPRFTDIRELQRRLKTQGVPLQQEANETTTGPASIIVVDPDGNPILFDQHV